MSSYERAMTNWTQNTRIGSHSWLFYIRPLNGTKTCGHARKRIGEVNCLSQWFTQISTHTWKLIKQMIWNSPSLCCKLYQRNLCSCTLLRETLILSTNRTYLGSKKHNRTLSMPWMRMRWLWTKAPVQHLSKMLILKRKHQISLASTYANSSY